MSDETAYDEIYARLVLEYFMPDYFNNLIDFIYIYVIIYKNIIKDIEAIIMNLAHLRYTRFTR